MFAVDNLGRIAVLAARPSFAAHSMDTAWYAIDRQGHVAQWWSGEEGAVPYAAHQQPWEGLCVDLALHHALGSPTAAASGERRIVTLDRRARIIGVHELPGSWSGVIQFEDAEYQAMFQADYPHWVERVLDGAPCALEVHHVVAEAFRDYWSAGAIRAACAMHGGVSPHALGLYEYSCGFSGPYRREHTPAQRLLIHELPAPLRGKLSALQLGFDFDSTASFDPATKLQCRTYR